MLKPLARVGACVAVLAALLGVGAASASAHIQVTPTVAAPEDAVKFTVLVPGERSDATTTKVALQIPPGVLPYSYGETPGWSRKLVLAKDQSVAQVVWTGEMASDGFVELSFLAATPPKPGVLSWKALQFYSDGQVVRWIGSPSSEQPAAETRVEAGAALQNAGGEGASGEEAGSVAAPEAVNEDDGDSGDGTDWLARGLALAALVVGLLVLGIRRLRGGAAVVLVALLALGAGSAQAAAPQPCGDVPQISDPNGDGHHSSSDVLGAWFSEEAGRLQAVIKVKAGSWQPEHEDAELNGSGYALIFNVGGSTAYVRARGWPHSEKPVSFDYGTYAPGSWFTSAGATGGGVAYAAFGGTVTIDVPAATGAVTGAHLAAPFVLTYDGITAGEPDWVDQAPGGNPPSDPARGADYVVGSCGAAGGGVVAVALEAPKRIVGAGKVTVSGRVVPARAGVAVELTRSGQATRVSRLGTDAAGRFSVRLPIREATELRAVAEGIGSQAVKVGVRSKVRIRLRELRSGALRVLGRIDPGLPGRLLLLGVNEVAPVEVRRAHGARFAFRLPADRLAPGGYQVVYVPAKGRAERSTSNTVRVR